MSFRLILIGLLALLSISLVSGWSTIDDNVVGSTSALQSDSGSSLSPIVRLKSNIRQSLVLFSGRMKAKGDGKKKDKDHDKEMKEKDKKDKKDKQDQKDKKGGKKDVLQLVDSGPTTKVVAAGGVGGPVFSCIIDTLHPTQFAVGFEAVKKKRKTIQEKQKKGEFNRYLAEKPIPVVLGPGDTFYLIDHHHLSRSLHEEKIKHGLCTQLADWSDKSIPDFWKAMEKKAWVFMKDETGVPITYDRIPDHVAKLTDNPYRSLAGFVRDAGGFSKTTIPFTEFFWADYFRRQVPLNELQTNFAAAVKKGMELARLPGAAKLPGALSTTQQQQANIDKNVQEFNLSG